MPTCFVIQPFDAGKFDKRYEDVYAPAIRAAELEPYRVDLDPDVDVPIDAIEKGIRSAVLSLADITTDNPNVWYELGFAFASGRPVIMVCADERTGKKYPFDIQHRTVIPYKAESSQDFEALKCAITSRIQALLKRTDTLQAIRDTEQVALVQGLSQPELAVIATVAGSVDVPDGVVPANAARRDMEQAGFTPIGFAIGLKRLREKRLVTIREASADDNETYHVICITGDGWDWIERNEDKFILRRPPRSDSNDIPF